MCKREKKNFLLTNALVKSLKSNLQKKKKKKKLKLKLKLRILREQVILVLIVSYILEVLFL